MACSPPKTQGYPFCTTEPAFVSWRGKNNETKKTAREIQEARSSLLML